jgi:hypothetical protein
MTSRDGRQGIGLKRQGITEIKALCQDKLIIFAGLLFIRIPEKRPSRYTNPTVKLPTFSGPAGEAREMMHHMQMKYFRLHNSSDNFASADVVDHNAPTNRSDFLTFPHPKRYGEKSAHFVIVVRETLIYRASELVRPSVFSAQLDHPAIALYSAHWRRRAPILG